MAADFVGARVTFFDKSGKYKTYGHCSESYMSLYCVYYKGKYSYLVPTNLQVIGIDDLFMFVEIIEALLRQNNSF